jgi:hypothetical protein
MPADAPEREDPPSSPLANFLTSGTPSQRMAAGLIGMAVLGLPLIVLARTLGIEPGYSGTCLPALAGAAIGSTIPRIMLAIGRACVGCLFFR